MRGGRGVADAILPRLKQESDTGALLEIWERSFGDSRNYIENFFRFAAKDENTVVSCEDGRAVSAAYLLDCHLNIHGTSYPAYYFYAAATLPEYRGKGHMGAIIRYVISLAEERGIDFVFLVPAEGSLYRYYTRFGFRTCFYSETVTYSHEEFRYAVKENSIADLKSGPADPSLFRPTDVAQVRELAYSSIDHVQLSPEAMQYVLFEHASCGGGLLCDGSSYALFQEENGTLEVKEICPPVLDGSMARALLARGADKYVIHAPTGSAVRGRRTTAGRAGMAIALNRRARTASGMMKDAYIGITLG